VHTHGAGNFVAEVLVSLPSAGGFGPVRRLFTTKRQDNKSKTDRWASQDCLMGGALLLFPR